MCQIISRTMENQNPFKYRCFYLWSILKSHIWLRWCTENRQNRVNNRHPNGDKALTIRKNTKDMNKKRYLPKYNYLGNAVKKTICVLTISSVFSFAVGFKLVLDCL